MDSVGLLFIFALTILFFTITTMICIHIEKKAFNNGVCTHCGNKLIPFDFDSQGGLGFECETCEYVIWLSYKCVYKNYLKNSEKGE